MLDESLSAQVDALIAQVGAFQAQIVALRVSIEAWQREPVPQERPLCPHLNTQDAGGTLGHPRRRCLDCGEPVES